MKKLAIALLIIILGSSFSLISKHAIDADSEVYVDKRLVGIWKLAEDTDKHNYLIVEREDDYLYSVTYMNQSGNNRAIERSRAWLSVINGQKFLNISYRDSKDNGFMIIRLPELEENVWSLKAVLVNGKKFSSVENSDELKDMLSENPDNPEWYADTIHLKKLHALKAE